MGLYANIYKAFSLPSVASLACVWTCLAMDLVRGPRRSSSMDSLPPSRPRRSPSRPRRSLSRPRRSPWSWSWSRRSPWLPWVGVLGPPPSFSPQLNNLTPSHICLCCFLNLVTGRSGFLFGFWFERRSWTLTLSNQFSSIIDLWLCFLWKKKFWVGWLDVWEGCCGGGKVEEVKVEVWISIWTYGLVSSKIEAYWKQLPVCFPNGSGWNFRKSILQHLHLLGNLVFVPDLSRKPSNLRQGRLIDFTCSRWNNINQSLSKMWSSKWCKVRRWKGYYLSLFLVVAC